jgi:hypothetical protein
MSEAEAKIAINALNLSMPDETLLKAQIAGMRMVAARPKQNEVPETLAAALGIGGLTGAGAVIRVKELLGGKQMHYEAPLSPGELVGRLQTRLGDKFRVARSGDSIVLTSLADGSRLCEVRLSIEAEATSVSVSRPSTDKAKNTASDVTDEALRRATRPGGFGGFGGLVDLGRRVVSTVVDTAGDLAEVNAVVDTIETFGAEAENALSDLKAQLAADARNDELKEYNATHCSHCGNAFPAGSTKCSTCGANVG